MFEFIVLKIGQMSAERRQDSSLQYRALRNTYIQLILQSIFKQHTSQSYLILFFFNEHITVIQMILCGEKYII